MWIDAWGRRRLALVNGEDGKTYFVRWFDASEYAREKAAAEAQDGGLREIGAADVRGLRKPPYA